MLVNKNLERTCAPLSFMMLSLSLSWWASGASTKLTRWNETECSERTCKPRPSARHRRRHSRSQHPSALSRTFSMNCGKAESLWLAHLLGCWVVVETARRDVLALSGFHLEREMLNQRRAFRRQNVNSIIPINAPQIRKCANYGGFNWKLTPFIR